MSRKAKNILLYSPRLKLKRFIVCYFGEFSHDEFKTNKRTEF